MGGGQTFSVVGDDENEEDVSKANILASEASKLFAGARILRDLYGPEILVL